MALPRGPLRSGTALPRQRTSVTPAAGRRSSGGAASPQPDDGASEEALEKLSLVQLRALCADAGLPASGKKAELAARLAAHSAGSTATTQSGTADADYADAPDAAVTMSELAAALKIELASQTRVQLASCLAERGLPTAGSKEALAERLAEAIASQCVTNACAHVYVCLWPDLLPLGLSLSCPPRHLHPAATASLNAAAATHIPQGAWGCSDAVTATARRSTVAPAAAAGSINSRGSITC